MYVVTVTFVVTADRIADFSQAVAEQASNSLALEDDCHVFEVLVADDKPGTFFLYEKYETAAAFQLHLDSEHFKAFDRLVAPWVVSKSVDVWAPIGEAS